MLNFHTIISEWTPYQKKVAIELEETETEEIKDWNTNKAILYLEIIKNKKIPSSLIKIVDNIKEMCETEHLIPIWLKKEFLTTIYIGLMPNIVTNAFQYFTSDSNSVNCYFGAAISIFVILFIIMSFLFRKIFLYSFNKHYVFESIKEFQSDEREIKSEKLYEYENKKENFNSFQTAQSSIEFNKKLKKLTLTYIERKTIQFLYEISPEKLISSNQLRLQIIICLEGKNIPPEIIPLLNGLNLITDKEEVLPFYNRLQFVSSVIISSIPLIANGFNLIINYFVIPGKNPIENFVFGSMYIVFSVLLDIALIVTRKNLNKSLKTKIMKLMEKEKEENDHEIYEANSAICMISNKKQIVNN